MLLVLFTIACIFICYKIVKTFTYWTDNGVQQPSASYLLRGVGKTIFRTETIWDAMLNLYRVLPEARYVGMYQFHIPSLLIRDPELIKQLTVKDFDHFVDHRQAIPEGIDPLWSKNLFALKGNRWRDLRSTLSPSFTTSKMKMIFILISECAEEFTNHFTQKGVTKVELKDACTRYTNDVIATAAFGIKCNSLKEPENEFYVMGKEATNISGFWQFLKFMAFTCTPQLCKKLGMTFFPPNVREFFTRVIMENIQMREGKGIVRHDMLHLLMEARKGRRNPEENHDLVDTGFATVEESSLPADHKITREEITDVDITAQALIFFFAGFETVSTLMCFMGHELTVNPDIQRKLQEEVDATLKECGGKLTYEALMQMKYMDAVVSESLRKWSPAVGTDRVCVKPYTIEPQNPGEKPVHIKVGDMIWIAINGLHRDPQYYPEPDRFDPERFSDENKDNIKAYTFIPFGVGPRNCIGSRFALLEVKTIFFHLLSKFDLVVVKETPIPLKLSTKTFNLVAEGGFWIGMESRANKSLENTSYSFKT